MNKIKSILPKSVYCNLIAIYSKIVPFWIIKLLPNRTTPALQRYNFILELAQKNNIHVFIETGTYLGNTTSALSDHFNKIYTFEISEDLVKLARKRFEDKKHIQVIHGDSGIELEKILPKINEPVIFWLDGHYSEGFLHSKKNNLDTPIIKEIKDIFESNIKNEKNIILIDDAFEFDGTRGYPTLQELKSLVEKYTNTYEIYVKYNIVFILPKTTI
jgi:hypothetical protein